MAYDNTGKVSLWPNQSDNEKAPQFKGKVYAHRDIKAGEEIAISLWSNQNANPHGPTYNEKAPRFTGKVEDKFVPKGASNSQPPPAGPDVGDGWDGNKDFDDSVPF